MASDLEEYFTTSCVRGYHVYKDIWTHPYVGETLPCRREPTNVVDRYAVSVIKDGAIVGHLPKKISKLCSLFLRRGGFISCEVTGRRRRSADLAQGGLEIPCFLLLKGKKDDLLKLMQLLKSKDK